ncbi:hypothetical protein ACU8KH_00709 [Lachancea thermotolerans]
MLKSLSAFEQLLKVSFEVYNCQKLGEERSLPSRRNHFKKNAGISGVDKLEPAVPYTIERTGK